MSFLHPTYLWGLFGLLVPLIVHLLNKGEVKTIKVGSIQFLEAQETTQTKKLKLNEYALLLLRMLLLGLLVLAISGPTMQSPMPREALTYFIEPSLLQNNKMKSLLESKPQASFRLFSTDFPSLDTDEIPNTRPNYWQLVQSLNDFPSDSMVIFSESRISGIRGIRPKMSPTINWVVMNQESTLDTIIGAYKTEEDVDLVRLLGDNSYTDIQKIPLSANKNRSAQLLGDSLKLEENGKSSTVELWRKDTLGIGLFYDSDFSRDAQYMMAALDAVSTYAKHPMNIEAFKDEAESSVSDFDFLIWLKSGPPPKTDNNDLMFKPDSLSGHLISKGNKAKSYFLTERLSITNTLEGKLAESLLEIISPSPELTEKIVSLDKRVLASEELVPLASERLMSDIGVEKSALEPWFWLLAIMGLVVERILSKVRRQ
jgi:hypothetical protein